MSECDYFGADRQIEARLVSLEAELEREKAAHLANTASLERKNVQEKEAFMKVTYTVLAKICATIPNFKWAADMFPEAHQHAFKETAQLKTSCHTDPTINLACMKTSAVIQVLKQLIQCFLTLLAERMDEDEKAA